MVRHEAKCIEEIVRTISIKLDFLTSDENKHLIGIETRMEDLESKLEIGSGGVLRVGILGVGGSGKTTLVSFAYKKISPNFEAHCLLENIRDESKNGLKNLQKKLLSQILKTEVKLKSEEEGRSMIKRRLGNKKVLIVLDDVDDLKQLKALVGSLDWFGEGSRIIITTRDQHLLTDHRTDKIYGVSLLTDEESIKLFRIHAYREDEPVEDYESLSLRVVSYASGLPLALEILGSFLYDKDKDEWMSALAKLKDIPNQKIMDVLKISYDGLQYDEKQIFLDIACFLRRWPVDRAKMVLNACGFYTDINVRVLVQKSLINVSNGIFDMHDMIEEMAHYIVRGELHPEMNTRVWLEKDVLDICAMDTTSENDKTEVLALPPRLPHLVPFITTVLWTHGFPTPSLPSHVTNPRLPRAVANMKKLRWIYWEGYPESSLPPNFQPTNIRCLMLVMGGLKELWQGYKLLPNLKILDLGYSKYLKKTPDFNGLPLLERLNLKACLKLKEIHLSIGYHERVVFIGMKGCSKLKRFPPIIQMKNLETLKLSECKKLKTFPVIQRRMDSLVKLCLDGSGIEIIPLSVGQFCTSLEFFDLRHCSELKTIEGNFHLLKRLKYLHLNGCRKLERLADNFFDVECCLDVLFLCSQDSKSFKNLMNRIGSHLFHQDSSVSMKFPKFPRFLRKLDISSSNLEDGDIPSDICELLNLQELNLSRNNFSRLDSSLSRLPCLKRLDLSDCYYLEELPDLPSSISILKATECDSLKSVGDLSKYKRLWKVSLWRDHKLIGGEGALRSLLQGNVVEDHFMSVRLPGGPQVTNKFPNRRTYTLELPDNWHNEFSGFLICADNLDDDRYIIVIHQEMSMSVKSQPGHWEEFDKIPKSYDYAQVGYIPFSSLQKYPWWNPAYTKITFQLEGIANPKVRLVPWKVIADSRWRGKGAMEFKDDKRFRIIGDSKSLIMIIWSHGVVGRTFMQTKMHEIDGDVEPTIGQIETGALLDERMKLLIGYQEFLKKEKLVDSKGRGKGAIEFEDEKYDKTFRIIGDSKSLDMIIWHKQKTAAYWDMRMDLFTTYQELKKKRNLIHNKKMTMIKRA